MSEQEFESISPEVARGARGRTMDGSRLTPGVNVDPVDIDAGVAMAIQHGWLRDANDAMLIGYALQRHARGEEEGAEASWLSHFGKNSFTGWRMVLAAAVASGTENLAAGLPPTEEP